MLLEISEEDIIRRIANDNHWWQLGAIAKDYHELPRRLYFDLLYKLVKPVENRRAVVLMGPRRVGKTVMLHHAVQRLIDEGVPPQKIVYLSVDAPIYNGIPLDRLFELSRRASGQADADGYYVFFDEIQYLENWELHLKDLFDRLRSTKFIVSGSAAAALKLKSRESGAGRFTDFLLPPLTFYEFLQMQGLGELMEPYNYDWAGNSIELVDTPDIARCNQLFLEYINSGGYPESVLNQYIRQNADRFVMNDIIDKVLAKDLPYLYGINDTQELTALFKAVAFNTGKEFTLEKLSQNSRVPQAEIKDYLEYLEAAFLIKRIQRVDMAGRYFKRESFAKIYLTNPSLRAALFSPIQLDDKEIGDVVETAIVAQWMHRPTDLFYARWDKVKGEEGDDGEVDIVKLDSHLKPAFVVACKWSDRYPADVKALGNLLSFMRFNRLTEAIVTTQTIRQTKEVQGLKLEFIPAALYAYVVGRNTLNQHRQAALI